MMAVLSVLLLILKIIGITLLVVLGLLLLVILLVLFVPIRYKGHALKTEGENAVFELSALASWLNPLLRIRVWFEEKKVHFTVRLIGFCLVNSDREKKEKKPKKEKKKKEKKEATSEENEVQPEQKELQSECKEIQPEPNEVSPEHNAVQPEVEEVHPENEESEESASEVDSIEGAEQKVRFGERLKAIFDKIHSVVNKIIALPGKILQTIKKKVTHVVESIKLLIKKKDAVVRFVTKEANKVVIADAFRFLRKVLKHILPRKIKGWVHYGTGDPESTGKAIGIASIFYPVYAKNFRIEPDFNEKVVEGEVNFRGKIRIITLLVMFLRFWWNKQTKRFRKELKRLKKVLKEKAE